MFTVLHRYEDGIEVFHEAIEVTKQKTFNTEDWSVYVSLASGGNVELPIQSYPRPPDSQFAIIVMNANGKTVAMY